MNSITQKWLVDLSLRKLVDFIVDQTGTETENFKTDCIIEYLENNDGDMPFEEWVKEIVECAADDDETQIPLKPEHINDVVKELLSNKELREYLEFEFNDLLETVKETIESGEDPFDVF